jgi:glycosyltransferase involved in cell wall biosynthesis
VNSIHDSRGDSKRARESPPLSVVMPVHNVLPYLDKSIASILNQKLRDFEFVILDDASTDGSTARLRDWAQQDSRIRLYESRSQLGPSASSNFIVRKARAPILARMDADDVSHPERLIRQWEIIRSRPEVALLGTLYEGINGRGQQVRPSDRWRVARSTAFLPFVHGSIMFRREYFEEVGGYREECAGWEDYDLLLRMRERGLIMTLGNTLYSYRFHTGNVMGDAPLETAMQVTGLRLRCLAELRRKGEYNGLCYEAQRNGRHHPDTLAETLFLRGSIRLWAGHPPKVLGLLLSHKPSAMTRKLLRTWVWAIWAEVNPASLRFFLRSLIAVRDFLVSRRVKEGEVYEWRFK